MVDLKYLKKCGVSSGHYKKIWTQDPSKYTKRQKKLVEIISDRLKRGRENSLSEWKAYKAIDIAYDAPFNQITPTLVSNILNQNLDEKQTLEALKEWGLSESELFMDVQLPNGQTGKALNYPVLIEVLIPIVKSYVAIRTAKIFNDRNTSPLLQFEPLHDTARNRIYCEIITGIVNGIATNYGYSSVLRQAIMQMNKYGIVLTFPREEWDCQRQIVEDENGKEKTVTVKEGIRYVLPDPTQLFYDLSHPLTTLNTGTGCEYAGHWHLKTYGDIFDNPLLWNRDRIFAGTNWHTQPNAKTYLKEYFPCNMQFPNSSMGPAGREERQGWYSGSDRDKSVFVAEYFMWLCPNDWDLVDRKQFKGYKHKLWHRFTMTGDDTVCWSEPGAYNPTWFLGYDYDMQAGRTSSLALETIPWQDQLGNVLSQLILCAKQNLSNCTFYDKNMVDAEDIKRLVNSGERQYRSMNYVGYDSFKWGRGGLNPERAFAPQQLTKHNLNELFQLVPMILNIMERVLQISAQETGTTAAHYQSAKEIGVTASNSSQRLQFTASYADDGIAAWKRQIVDAALSYKDPEFIVQVSAHIPDVEKHLADMGFTVVEKNDDRITVRGHKSKIRLEQFADTEREPDKEKYKEIAQVMFQTIGVIAGQEMLSQEVGAKAMVKMIEQAAIMAGAPKDFTLPVNRDAKGGPVITPELMQALQQMQATMMQTITEKIAKPAAEAMAQSQQEIQQVQGEVGQMQQVIKQLEGIFKIAQAQNDKTRIAEQEAASQMQIEQAAHAQRLELERQQTEAEIARKTAEAQASVQIAQAEAQASITRENQKAAAKLLNDKRLAEAKAEAAKVAAANKPKPAAKKST